MKSEEHDLEKKTKEKNPTFSLPPPHFQTVIDTLTHGKAQKRHLDSISWLNPLNYSAS